MPQYNRKSESISAKARRKVLGNRAKSHGYIKSGQSTSHFATDRLALMARG